MPINDLSLSPGRYHHPIIRHFGLKRSADVHRQTPLCIGDGSWFKYHGTETDRRFVFLTNIFKHPALIIAELYRYRRRTELFFKRIKRHLRIKSLFSATVSVAKFRVRIALPVSVLVGIIKKRLNMKASLYSIHQTLSLTVFSTISYCSTAYRMK